MKKEIVTYVITCNLCGKELEGREAGDIVVTVDGSEYYNFHLCHKHWLPLCTQLQKIRRSTGSPIK